MAPYILEPSFVNVVVLGADPTGVTDSAPVIQQALDTAAAKGYRRVYIPAIEQMKSDPKYTFIEDIIPESE